MQFASVGAIPLTIIAVFISASAAALSPDLPSDIKVALDVADQSRLGVATQRLEAVQVSDTVSATARVLDISALIALSAEIDSASAAAEASASNAKRTELLVADDLNASQQTLESARALALADAARLRLARQRVALEWGTGLAGLGATNRNQLIDQVVAGNAALLRVDPLQSGDAVGGIVRIETVTGSPPIATEFLGYAASVDARLQTTGLLVALRGDSASALQAGRVVAAEIETSSQLAGVVLPRDALIRADGRTWAYLRHDTDLFVRREVLDAKLIENGWFVSSNFAAGDEVVVAGSGSLFAVEQSDEAAEPE